MLKASSSLPPPPLSPMPGEPNRGCRPQSAPRRTRRETMGTRRLRRTRMHGRGRRSRVSCPGRPPSPSSRGGNAASSSSVQLVLPQPWKAANSSRCSLSKHVRCVQRSAKSDILPNRAAPMGSPALSGDVRMSACRFADPNRQKRGKIRVRLGRPVGVGLSYHACGIQVTVVFRH